MSHIEELLGQARELRVEADRLEREAGWMKSDPSGLPSGFTPEPHIHPDVTGTWTGHCHEGGWTPHRQP